MRIISKRILLLLLSLSLVLTCGCAGRQKVEYAESIPEPAPIRTEQSGPETKMSGKSKVTTAYFGTVCSMVVFDDFTDPAALHRFEKTWKELKSLLSEIEEAVSVDIADSDIARFNSISCGESIEICGHTANILQTAKRAYADTGGLYDPTVFPLVDLWGFSPRFSDMETADHVGEAFPPEDEFISAFAALADFSGVLVSGGGDKPWRLGKEIPSVDVRGIRYEAKLDLGGIAKGYAAEECTRIMRGNGYEYGYFSCGGSSLSLLSGQEGENDVFMLGMKKPRGQLTGDISYITVPAARCGLSTSGDYDHACIADGIRYCHLINPETGWPSNTPAADGRQRGIATATVIGDDAAYTDCLSTAVCLTEPRYVFDFVNEKLNGYSVALVLYDTEKDFYEIVTNIPKGSFTIDDENYVLASRINDQGKIQYTGQIFSDLIADTSDDGG